MKFISLGNIQKRIYLYILICAITKTILNIINRFYFSTKINDTINISLGIIIKFAGLLLFCIPEYIIRRNYNKIKNENDNKSSNKIIFIFNNPKKINFKGFTFLIIFFVFYMLIYYIITIYGQINKDESFIFQNEATQSLIIVFLIILSKIINKTNFYKHQYLSMIIVIIMGIIRFIINIKQYNYIFKFPDNILSLFLGIFYHFVDASSYFILKRYMENNYYSPLFMGFIIGTTFCFTSSLIYIIFSSINCDSKICLILSEKTVISGNITIIILIILSINYSIYFLVDVLTLENYTIFHFMMFITIGKIVEKSVNFSENYLLEEIIILITFIIDIFSILVFVEIIILNFFGLNYNIKRNIISRALSDVSYILDSEDNDDDSSNKESNSKSDLKETN